MLYGILAIPRLYNFSANAQVAAFKNCTEAIKIGIPNAYTIKQGEFPTVDEVIANSYSVDGKTYAIMGARDFELSLTTPSGVELIGSLPTQPGMGDWQEIYVCSPDVAHAKYYTKLWYSAQEGRIIDGL